MKKNILISLVFVMLVIIVSADSIGLYENNKSMEITNYCQAGVCTFMNLTSLEYPNGTIEYLNAPMTQNGQVFNYSFTPTDIGVYNFVTCGDSSVAICDKDDFEVNYDGEEHFIGINIILLLLFVSLLLGTIYLNRNIDYEKWYSNILNKYKYRNFFKMTMAMIGYNFMKNTFGIYYLLGFPIMIILTDIILVYNVLPLIGIITTLMWVYTWGVLLIGVMLGGQLHEFISRIVDDFNKMDWGLNDE